MAGMRVYKLRGFPSRTREKRCIQLGSFSAGLAWWGLGRGLERWLNWQGWELCQVTMSRVLIKMKILMHKKGPFSPSPGCMDLEDKEWEKKRGIDAEPQWSKEKGT